VTTIDIRCWAVDLFSVRSDPRLYNETVFAARKIGEFGGVLESGQSKVIEWQEDLK
jgi:hypothetical protein